MASGPDDDRRDAQAPPGSAAPPSHVIAFGAFRIDLARRRLSRDGRRIRIQRKPLDVLIHLASNPGRVVTRAELLQAFWPSVVHEEALTRCISIVRKALDDAREPPRYIETVWGQGYRFLQPVTHSEAGSPRGTGRPESAVQPAQEPPRPERPVHLALVLRWRRRLGLTAVVLVAALMAVLWWRQADRAAAPPAERIAVLPMVWESPSDQWLAKALTEHLAQTVARIEGVTVIAHFATEPGNEPVDLRVTGRRLNVGAVLATQLVRTGDGIGLRARLVAGVPMARYALGLSHAGLEEWPSAVESYRAAQPDLGLEIVGGPLVYALARGGEPERAEALIAELERLAGERYVPPSKLAIAWLGLGERTRSLAWLERAVEVRDDRLVYLGVDPHFRELQTEPAFRAIAEQVGLLDLFDPH